MNKKNNVKKHYLHTREAENEMREGIRTFFENFLDFFAVYSAIFTYFAA